MEAFFNVLTDEKFLRVLALFSQGRGYNPEDKTCDFPADFAEEEGGPPERFDYIEVWAYAVNQEVRVPIKDFTKHLLSAVDMQLLLDPNRADVWKKAAAKAVTTLNKIENDHLSYVKHRIAMSKLIPES